jgi:sulfur carrier protein
VIVTLRAPRQGWKSSTHGQISDAGAAANVSDVALLLAGAGVCVACASVPPLMSESTHDIAIIVNGDTHAVPAGLTIGDLLVRLGLGGRRVAVERNRAVVPRAEHAATQLADGDRLEVVAFVGGG